MTEGKALRSERDVHGGANAGGIDYADQNVVYRGADGYAYTTCRKVGGVRGEIQNNLWWTGTVGRLRRGVGVACECIYGGASMHRWGGGVDHNWSRAVQGKRALRTR